MPIKTAYVGDTETSVIIDYPVYYVFRHRDDDKEPFMFLKVEIEKEDVGFSAGIALFLRNNFVIDRISETEAETYEVFGVAPIYDRERLVEWVIDLNKEIRDSIEKWGMDEDQKVRCGDYVYDLSNTWNENKQPPW